ncbi:MAG: hypothetical protein MI810_14310 [Flavobacteriales bacterium]|nr:hypothetical protein [Flavobacteriales bacterium]
MIERLYSILFFLMSFTTFSQSEEVNADSLVSVAMDKMKSIPEYECDITVDLDVKFINISQRKGKVYFLPPDSIRYKIKGFAFLPKKGYNSHAYSVAENDHIAIFLGKEEVDGKNCNILKVIPNDIESEVVLGQFWIDSDDRVRKMVIVTRDEGNYNLKLEYGDEEYAVPKRVTITFDVKEQKLPASMTGDLEAADDADEDPNERQKGEIVINYSNYIFKP